MKQADVNTGLLIAAFLMAGVGTWAGFSARAQVEKDYRDLRPLAEGNLEMIEAIGERVDKGLVGPAAPTVAADDADGSAGETSGSEAAALRTALAEANKRISRVSEDRKLLQDRVRRHIEETDELNAKVVALEERQATLKERLRRLLERLPKGDGVDLRDEASHEE